MRASLPVERTNLYERLVEVQGKSDSLLRRGRRMAELKLIFTDVRPANGLFLEEAQFLLQG